MGCHKGHRGDNCVCDILKEIADAQSDVIENCCESSCEQSIDELLGETDRRGKDTVPLILYCRDGCQPFKGFGTLRKHGDHLDEMQTSFIFRVKKVMDDCCAIIELLLADADLCKDLKNPKHQETKNLKATGICITVDLNCFCHVTCLPAINALE
ncbi:MAG TPA: CotY/CotZ family spore coat protein [Bacillota bacterium]|nr:CotY/CotZ family spore coat protein [Bacillota bacterium]